MSARFEIISRTDFAETTIITIVDHLVPTTTWTLVSDADGHDTIVSPSGRHVDVSCAIPSSPTVALVLDWIMNHAND